MTDTAMHDRGDLTASNEAANRTTGILHNNVNDIDRMVVTAQLINTFNLAILKQAQRPQWNAADVRAFAIALAAVNQIGVEDVAERRDPGQQQQDDQQTETLDGLEAEVADLGVRSAIEHRTPMPSGPSFGQGPTNRPRMMVNR